jgi:hypothetical protein
LKKVANSCQVPNYQNIKARTESPKLYVKLLQKPKNGSNKPFSKTAYFGENVKKNAKARRA